MSMIQDTFFCPRESLWIREVLLYRVASCVVTSAWQNRLWMMKILCPNRNDDSELRFTLLQSWESVYLHACIPLNSSHETCHSNTFSFFLICITLHTFIIFFQVEVKLRIVYDIDGATLFITHISVVICSSGRPVRLSTGSLFQQVLFRQ